MKTRLDEYSDSIDLLKVLAVACPNEIRELLIVLMYFETNLPLKEVIELKFTHLSFNSEINSFNLQFRDGSIALSRMMSELLKMYLNKYQHEYLFTYDHNQTISYLRFRKSLNNLLIGSEWEGISLRSAKKIYRRRSFLEQQTIKFITNPVLTTHSYIRLGASGKPLVLSQDLKYGSAFRDS